MIHGHTRDQWQDGLIIGPENLFPCNVNQKDTAAAYQPRVPVTVLLFFFRLVFFPTHCVRLLLHFVLNKFVYIGMTRRLAFARMGLGVEETPLRIGEKGNDRIVIIKDLNLRKQLGYQWQGIETAQQYLLHLQLRLFGKFGMMKIDHL